MKYLRSTSASFTEVILMIASLVLFFVLFSQRRRSFRWTSQGWKALRSIEGKEVREGSRTKSGTFSKIACSMGKSSCSMASTDFHARFMSHSPRVSRSSPPTSKRLFTTTCRTYLDLELVSVLEDMGCCEWYRLLCFLKEGKGRGRGLVAAFTDFPYEYDSFWLKIQRQTLRIFREVV